MKNISPTHMAHLIIPTALGNLPLLNMLTDTAIYWFLPFSPLTTTFYKSGTLNQPHLSIQMNSCYSLWRVMFYMWAIYPWKLMNLNTSLNAIVDIMSWIVCLFTNPAYSQVLSTTISQIRIKSCRPPQAARCFALPPAFWKSVWSVEPIYMGSWCQPGEIYNFPDWHCSHRDSPSQYHVYGKRQPRPWVDVIGDS